MQAQLGPKWIERAVTIKSSQAKRAAAVTSSEGATSAEVTVTAHEGGNIRQKVPDS